MIELELLENKERREEMIDRIDILDRVGTLLLLPSTNHATTEQVANYFKVELGTIKMQLHNNRDEFEKDGMMNLSGKETKEFLVSNSILLTNFKGYFMAEGQRFANRNNILFSKRSILRMGMLLRDSEVAKEIRTRLLDIIQDVEKQQPQIINNVVNEIRNEQMIMQEMAQAMYDGDYPKESQLKTELIGMRTRRIKELENINKTITTNAVTIQDTRLVINRIVRFMADKRYHQNFKACWKYVWTIANYKLHINVKNRVKKKYEYLIDTLDNEELRQMELMVRNWCAEFGYDVEAVLKL
jgi:hypothetical protein